MKKYRRARLTSKAGKQPTETGSAIKGCGTLTVEVPKEKGGWARVGGVDL